MKSGFYFFAVLVCCAAALSCRSDPETAPAESGPAVVVVAPESPRENRPDDAAFSSLPPEARQYLERLARAFAAGEEAFLLAQGEPQFEAEMRPRYDKETYLALLYRAGPYAENFPRQDGPPSRLIVSAISQIQYLAWEENGPLLEITARLIGADGAITPCRIMLVWRLREPKIEGLFL
jgi:hypothetical protein